MYASFPNEILEKILERVHYKDLSQCQLVCHSWYVIARAHFYRHVIMDPRRIHQFIHCIRLEQQQFSLPNAGSMVQKVTLKHKPRHFLYTHDFTNINVFQLVHACPHLEVIECSNCEQAQVIMDGLLFFKTDATLLNLKQLPNIASELEQYKNCAYRFRSTLTTLTLPSSSYHLHHQRLDLGFLTGFPKLSRLDLGKNEVTSIGYLDALLNACPTLQELTFSFNIRQQQLDDNDDTNNNNNNNEENTSITTANNDTMNTSTTITEINTTTATNTNSNNNISISDFTKERYPTLKHLIVTTTQDTFPQILLDYILYRFNHLITLDIQGIDMIDTTLHMSNSFEALMHRMDDMRSCSLRLRGNEYNVNEQVAKAYLRGLSRSIKQHRITSIKIHNNHSSSNAGDQTPFVSYCTGVFGIQKRRYFQIRLPDFETPNEALLMDYVSQFSDHVNELSIDYQGTVFYKFALTYFYDLIMQHCSRLKTLKVNYAELDDMSGTHQNRSIIRLHLANSHIPQAFFQRLSSSLPCLKHLILNRNFHINDPRCIRIEMRQTELDTLALLGESYFPWISTLSRNHPIEEVMLVVEREKKATKYYYATVLSMHAVETDEYFAQNVISRRRAMSIYISTKSIHSLVLGTTNTNTIINIE